MNLHLQRTSKRSDGIFSKLKGEFGPIAATCEHSYWVDGWWQPKIPPGTYKCVRGMHRLHGMTEDFETFEITGVDGHSNLLFHWGNFNKDSEGCILVGEKEVVSELDLDKRDGPDHMVTNSRATFKKFMQIQTGVSDFLLTVQDVAA